LRCHRMLKRILLVVTPSGETLAGVRFVAETAVAADAQIVALNIVDTSIAKHLKSITGAGESETIVKLEQDGWRYLYDVEDACKALGAKIVLHQDEGFPEARISIAAKRFKADLVVVPHSRAGGYTQSRSERFIMTLIDRLECPVLVI